MAQTVRIATWNVCWFAGLFGPGDELLMDSERSGMYGVTRARQAEAIARVLRAVDADIFAVIEAPDTNSRHDTVHALRRFSNAFGLRQTGVLHGFESETEQEIALLFDPAVAVAEHDPKGTEFTEEMVKQGADLPAAPRFDGVYGLDLDGDGEIDVHRFSKPPLEAVLSITGGPQDLRVIAVHAKSKAPHGARNEKDAARLSLLNRRKQLAQCAWLRGRIEDHLDAGDDIIALGDFNDGPGLDKYERVFGRSGVEIVVGAGRDAEQQMRTPYLRNHHPSRPKVSTARFYNNRRKIYLNALLDFVMLSPSLVERTQPRWRIWHPFDDAVCYENDELRSALLEASDHFPVSVDLSFG